MQRQLLKNLQHWSQKSNRRPLLIRGARQVGKTWIIRQHGKAYSHFVELNLESQPQLREIFRIHYGDAKKLIHALGLILGNKIEPEKTLLFIDEIQESKEALLSLRYFKEQLPNIHIIAAGSLVEFALKELAFPVGRIEFFHLFPMNFQEYLLAKNREDLITAIQESTARHPLSPPIHQLLLQEVSNYILIGGMPEAVQTFVDTSSIQATQDIHQLLITSYRSDFNKYATRAQVQHIQKIFDSIPRLLGKKFKYSHIDRDVRSRELSTGLHLLTNAGLAYPCFHSSANGVPLSSEQDETKFKIFFLDIGLALRNLGLPLSQIFMDREKLLVNRGELAEQFVAQELLSFTRQNHSPQLFYWHRESRSSQAEIDFLIEQHDQVIPIEVKSAATGSMKSLHLFMKEKKRKLAYKISTHPEGIDEQGIHSLPFYALMKLQTL